LPVHFGVCHRDRYGQFRTGLDVNCIPICYLLFCVGEPIMESACV